MKKDKKGRKKKNTKVIIITCTGMIAFAVLGAIMGACLKDSRKIPYIEYSNTYADKPDKYIEIDDYTMQTVYDIKTGGNNGSDDTNTPGTPGSPYVPGDSWYSSAKGLATSTQKVEIAGLIMYNGLPWAPEDDTYVFNYTKAAQDVISYVDKTSVAQGGAQSGLVAKSAFTYEYTGAYEYTNINGVNAVNMALAPCVYDPDYCDNFTKTKWSERADGDNVGKGTRRYAVIVKSKADGNTYYMPMCIRDTKAHTFPGGVMQTHTHLNHKESDGVWNLLYGDWGATTLSNQKISDWVWGLDNVYFQSHKIRDFVKIGVEFMRCPAGAQQQLNNSVDIIAVVGWSEKDNQ